MESKVETVKHFKWFFPWQDAEQCAWLERMSKKGLHLAGRFFGFYTFTEGSPEEWLYRIDFCDVKRNFPRVEMIERCGWERATVSGSWVYYRGKAETTEAYTLFDSPTSRIEHYKAVLKAILFPGLPLIAYFPLMSLPVRRQRGPSIALTVLDVIIVIALVFVLFSGLRLRGRIRKLEKER